MAYRNCQVVRDHPFDRPSWYVGCSKWVDSDTFLEWQLSCT